MAAWLGLALALALFCTAAAQSSLTCASDEKLDATNTTCVCDMTKYNSTGVNPSPALQCLSGQMKLTLGKCQLEKDKYDSAHLHLLDPTCLGVREVNGIADIVVSTNTSSALCGNTMKVNTSHVIYSNNLTIPAKASGGIVSRNNVSFAFSCSYPLNMSTSLTTVLKPVVGVGNVALPGGVGNVTVTMGAFTDPSYNVPYSGDTQTLTVDSPLYVSVQMPELDGGSFSMKVIRLYATATSDPNAAQQYDIIINGCPASSDLGELLTVDRNGDGIEARFKIMVFKIASSDSVYLFANVQICEGICTPTCSASGRDGSGSTDSSLIQAGPYETGMTGQSGAPSCFNWPWTMSTLLLSLLGLRFL